jgi:hypothetical protein
MHKIIIVAVFLCLTACSAVPAPAPVTAPAPVASTSGATKLTLQHGVAITIPNEFAYQARLRNGEIASSRQPDVPVDPDLPQLAALRNLQREPPPLGPERPDRSVLLSTAHEDGGMHYDIHVVVAWSPTERDIEQMRSLIANQERLAVLQDQFERDMRADTDDAFSDKISIAGWTLAGQYPVIDNQYHSKKRHLQNFDSDYIYNRTLFIYRPGATIFVLIDLPESRRAAWKARIDAMIASIMLEAE